MAWQLLNGALYTQINIGSGFRLPPEWWFSPVGDTLAHTGMYGCSPCTPP